MLQALIGPVANLVGGFSYQDEDESQAPSKTAGNTE